jgi:hypothetical protein
MNNNIILNSFLLINKKLIKLFKLDNYFSKLLCILDFSDLYINIKTRNFSSKYKLFFSCNKIIEKLNLKYDIIYLYNLDKLVLDKLILDNSDKILPKEIGNLINLTHLQLSRNEFTIVPKEFEKLINLKKIYLDYNQLKIIPKQLGNLINLESMWLNNNQLKFIPKELGNLVNLKYFYLEHNKLKSLPIELNHLVNLEYFYINQNKLKFIPNFDKMIGLRIFNIKNNPLIRLKIDLAKFDKLGHFCQIYF